MHKKGVCSQEKVNSGDDTRKAYRDINNIDGIFALSARKYHYIAINGRQIYEYDTKVRKRTGNNEIKVRSIIDCKQASNKLQPGTLCDSDNIFNKSNALWNYL